MTQLVNSNTRGMFFDLDLLLPVLDIEKEGVLLWLMDWLIN